MPKLLSFSIETDQTVLLQYADSPEQRASISRLHDFVQGEDLKKIQSALKLRENYFKKHLPKLAVGVAIGGLIATVGLTQQNQISRLMHHPQTNKVVTQEFSTSDDRAVALATPSPSPSLHPAVLSATTTPSPSVSPSPSPSPSPNNNHKHKHHNMFILPFNIDIDLPMLWPSDTLIDKN